MKESVLNIKWGSYTIVIFLIMFFISPIVNAESRKLKVQLLPFLSFAPFFIAEEEGFFRELGLEIEFVKIKGSAGPIAALMKGDLDIIAAQVETGLLNVIAKGANVRYVADKGYLAADGCGAYALLARKDLVESGGLSSPADLKGRRLAIEPLTTEGYYVEKLLGQAGLTMGDITTVDLPPPVLGESLRNRSVDLVHIGEPWITRIESEGDAVVWMPVKALLPDFQWACIVFGPNLLEKERETGRLFMVAYLKAVLQYNEGKTNRNLEILTKHTKLDPNLLEKACWPNIRCDGKINLNSVVDYQKWVKKKGLSEGAVSQESFWDPSFVEYAAEVLTSYSE